MGRSASRLAAQTVRVLPRKRLSRALGRLTSARAPRPLVDAAGHQVGYRYDSLGIDQPECTIDGYGLIRPTGGSDPNSRVFPSALAS